MNENELLGKLVMVSPAFWVSDRVGQVGTVEFSDLSEDNVWLRFEDDEVERFHPNMVFQFKPLEELHLLAATREQPVWTPINLFLQQIALRLEFGSAEQIIKTYNDVKDDPELFRYATIRISESIEPGHKRRLGR
jgi:hypothetical protein